VADVARQRDDRVLLVAGIGQHEVDQGPQPRCRAVELGQSADDRLGLLLLPQVERRADEAVPVLVVPVEAALRGAQPGGERLDGDGVHAPCTQGLEGCPGPVGSGQALTRRHERTVPYGETIRRRTEMMT
jgi:hypothetical protein